MASTICEALVLEMYLSVLLDVGEILLLCIPSSTVTAGEPWNW